MLDAVQRRQSTPLWVHLARVLLGIIFLAAGASKLDSRFPSIIGPVWLSDRLEPYGLRLFAEFIAASEIGVGALLLIPALSTLGAIMLVPMLVCILVVTISLDWQGTPYVLAFLLLVNASLLFHDYPRWRGILPSGRDPVLASAGIHPWTRLDTGWILFLVLVLTAPLLMPGPGLLRLFTVSLAVLIGLVFLDRRQARRGTGA